MSAAARMRPPALQDKLLRAALHPDAGEASRAAAEWSAAVDIDTLDFASLQLLPMLTDRADPLALDPGLAEQVGKIARVTWLRSELLSKEVAPVIGELATAGLDPVLMKGAALVHGHGVRARLRPMFDVDLLVARENVPQAARILAASGYSARDQSALLSGEPRLLALKHGEDFRRGDHAAVDLHWSPLQNMRRPEIGRELMARAVPAQIAGIGCRALCSEDLICVTIAHAADSWRELRERWVGDCVLLMRGQENALDWEQIVENARRWRMARQTLDALDYLGEVAEISAPPAARRALARARTPLAVRLRRARPAGKGGESDRSGRLQRVLEDYEFSVGDRAALGARTGPADFAGYLVERYGLAGPRALPGELAFAAAGRPWRTRRRLRRGSAAQPAPAAGYELGARIDFGGSRSGHAISRLRLVVSRGLRRLVARRVRARSAGAENAAHRRRRAHARCICAAQ